MIPINRKNNEERYFIFKQKLIIFNLSDFVENFFLQKRKKWHPNSSIISFEKLLKK